MLSAGLCVAGAGAAAERTWLCVDSMEMRSLLPGRTAPGTIPWGGLSALPPRSPITSPASPQVTETPVNLRNRSAAPGPRPRVSRVSQPLGAVPVVPQHGPGATCDETATRGRGIAHDGSLGMAQEDVSHGQTQQRGAGSIQDAPVVLPSVPAPAQRRGAHPDRVKPQQIHGTGQRSQAVNKSPR